MKTTAVCLLSCLLAISAVSAQDFGQPIEREDYWNDAIFAEGFRDSYLPLPISDPKVADSEVDLVRDLLELIKVQPAAAAKSLQSQLKRDSSPALIFILGSLYLQSGEPDKAKVAYLEAIKRYPDYRRAHKNISIIYFQEKNFAKSIEHMTKAVSLGDQEAGNFGRLGFAYLQTEDYTAAESAYRNAMLMDPSVKDYKIGLAQALLSQGKNEQVIALMNSLLEKEPENEQLWLLQVNAYVALERYLDAAVNLEVIKAMEKANLENVEQLGKIYLLLEMYDQALIAYQSLLNGVAENKSTVITAADLFIKTRNWNNAAELINGIEDAFNLSNDEELQLLNMQAKIARAEGNEDRGAEILDKVIARNPNDGDALLELADYYANKASDLLDQVSELEKAEKPEQAESVRMEAISMTERAELKLDQAKKLDAYERRALIKHGQLLAGQRRYNDALPYLRRALEMQDEQRLERYLSRIEDAALRES